MSNNSIIDVFLHPKSVAVIGASKNPTKGGNRILDNLVRNNFKGKVYPVNPNAEGKVFGLEFKKSVLDIDENSIDLAIFYVPNKAIPEILEDCIQKGIKGAIIEASGFEEVGEEGMKLKEKIVKITDNFSKIRIVGPNCMGISRIDADSKSADKGGFFSGFGVFTVYKRGNIAIISQSGMLNGGYLMHLMSKYPDMGFRYSIAVGNKMDLTELEFLEYLIDDPTVNVIAMYLESFSDPKKFINLCRKAKKVPNKTIILVKGGITSQGQKATLSHTGSLSENSKLIEAVIKQAGVIQAHSFYDLFQFARTFSMMYNAGKKLPENGGVSMIVGSGGAGTITSDLTMKYGLHFPPLDDEAYETLVEVFPEWMPPNRFALIDFWPAMEKAMMNRKNPQDIREHIIKKVLAQSNIEGFFHMLFCSKQWAAMFNFEQMIKNVNQTSEPVFFWLVGDNKEVQRISRLLNDANIPVFTNLEEMVKNYSILVQETRNKCKKY